jgi:hypothetical protein
LIVPWVEGGQVDELSRFATSLRQSGNQRLPAGAVAESALQGDDVVRLRAFLASNFGEFNLLAVFQ